MSQNNASSTPAIPPLKSAARSSAEAPPSRLSDFPTPAAWRTLIVALLALAMLPVAGLVFDVPPDFARRCVILHASIAGVLLPLALTGQLSSHLQPAAHWTSRLLWLGITISGLAIPALLLSGTGQPLLVSYFPVLTNTIHPALLIGIVLTTALHLLTKPAAPVRRTDTNEGMGWLALPLLVTLTVLAWNWIATADVAPHIREELVAWGSGHAWTFALGSLAVWGWLMMAEVVGRQRIRWLMAVALASGPLLVAQVTTPIDSTDYLKQLNLLQLTVLWLAPSAVAISLLRDPVRRAVVGPWLWTAMALFFMPLAGASWLQLTARPDATTALRYGPLALQHGLGIATITALWGAIRHRQTMASSPNTQPRIGMIFLLGTLGIGTGLILLLATNTPRQAREMARPIAPQVRQHAIDSRQREITERFGQGVRMMQIKQHQHAVTAFHRVLELDPTIPEAHVNMGFALFELGDQAGAQRFFESATRLNKNQLNAYYGLALSARAQGAHEVAAGAMRTWLHLAPTDDPLRAKAEAIFDEASKASRKARQETITPNR